MGELKRLLRYLGPYRKDLLIGALLVVVETCFELVIPVLMADLIDVGVANQDIDYVLHKGGQMGICALCALVTGLLYARFAARASYGWGAQVRRAQFAQVQRYSFANLDHFDAASLVTRMTTDVTVLQNAINGGFRPLVRSPIMLVMGVGLSFWMNARLAVIFIVCAPILGAILFCIVRKVAPMYGRLQKAVDRLNNVVQENLTAIRAVKAFVRGEAEEERFQVVNSRLAALEGAANRRHLLCRARHIFHGGLRRFRVRHICRVPLLLVHICAAAARRGLFFGSWLLHGSILIIILIQSVFTPLLR